MMRSIVLVIAIAISTPAVKAQTTPAATPHHEANFDAERKQADELYAAQKRVEALPLYEDLCRQDPTDGVFAERHGAGLLAKEVTLTSPEERLKVHVQAMNEIRRARRLGDNSTYVSVALDADAKTPLGAIIAGIPLTVGWTYHGTPEMQAVFREAEAAFQRKDLQAAVKLYTQAAELDPRCYDPALYAGDMYFRLKDVPSASAWYAKAIAIDPDRETAYRYWGDALVQVGDIAGARAKYVDAVVAEPSSSLTFSALRRWAQHTGRQLAVPVITRPDFITPGNALKVDPVLAESTQDGRSSWIVYQQYRVAHGARTLNQLILDGGSDANAVVTVNGYRHTIAEEHAALRAMLADVNAKIKAGTLSEASLDPSIHNIRTLEGANALGAWIAINAADAGIRSDYPDYRANHRKHLVDYVNDYLIH